MPKKTDPAVRRLIERNAHKKFSATQMRAALLRAKANGELLGEIPPVRTISDIMSKARETAPEDSSVYWPESFSDLGPLPWEASASYFDLLEQLQGRRPLVPLMTWFWKISQVLPEEGPSVRWRIAADLATRGMLPGDSDHDTSLEVYVAFQRGGFGGKPIYRTLPKDLQYAPGVRSRRSYSELLRIGPQAYEIRYGALDIDEREQASVLYNAASVLHNAIQRPSEEIEEEDDE